MQSSHGNRIYKKIQATAYLTTLSPRKQENICTLTAAPRQQSVRQTS